LPGIQIAIQYGNSTPVAASNSAVNESVENVATWTGTRTLEKRKRKKRAAKIIDDDNVISVKLNDSTELLYSKFVHSQFFKAKKS